MDSTILFIYLKIILLQYFSFQFSTTINSIQTDPIPYKLGKSPATFPLFPFFTSDSCQHDFSLSPNPQFGATSLRQKLVQNLTHRAYPSATSIHTYTHDTTIGIGKKIKIATQKNLQVPSVQ